uniref:Uncharacterized protein n=1 Tax=Oryza punctata TaxID=4537 RepID=A0A0E0JXA3_ORYPU
MARLLRPGRLLALLQLAVALWLAATAGYFCRPIQPDGDRPRVMPPSPRPGTAPASRSFFEPPPPCPPDCSSRRG